MDNRILVIGGHGLGDCLTSIQCAEFLMNRAYGVDVKISTRDEIFRPLQHLFPYIEQIDPKYTNDNILLKDEAVLKEVTDGYDEFYYEVPDLLFTHPHSFDFKKFRTYPHIIKTMRTLTKKARPENRIYLGLMTTTKGYTYTKIAEVAYALADQLPEYEVYLPLTTKWASTDVPEVVLPARIPTNLVVTKDVPFEANLDILARSCYFIGTDNGPSHVAYHLGMPRLILDPQFDKMPWIARWKEDYLESLPIGISPESVVDVVKANLRVPATTLLPRRYPYMNPNADWKRDLIIKF